MKANLAEYLPARGVKTHLQATLREVAAGAGSAEILSASAVVDGRTFTPDDAVGFVVMDICHAFPSVTAYGTALHPRTLARCFRTLEHKVFNLGHRMKSYLTPEQLANLPDREKRDMMLGSVAAVEFPPEPAGGWNLSLSDPPCIRACASFAKQSEAAAAVARHGDRWSVSQEINFNLHDSGWLIMQPGKVTDKTAEWDLVQRHTPDEVHALGMGYVPCVEAPESLMACFNGGRVTGPWQGSPVVLLKGGLGDGNVAWIGVGYVQIPAETEARITTILAAKMEDGGWKMEAETANELTQLFTALKESSEKMLTASAKALGTGLANDSKNV